MRFVRFTTFISSVLTLAALAAGSAVALVNFYGSPLASAKAVVARPLVLIGGLYEFIGGLGFPGAFWYHFGPLVALALLVALAINTIPSRSNG